MRPERNANANNELNSAANKYTGSAIMRWKPYITRNTRY